jgi:anti-sigma B factor antagonist
LRPEVGELVANPPSTQLTWYGTEIAVLELRGEHDLTSKEELETTLRQALLGGELLIVDLTEAEFIDSSVLNNLMGVERLAQERGRRVALQVDPSSSIARVLEIAGLTEHFPCAASRQHAATLVGLGDFVSDTNGPAAA